MQQSFPFLPPWEEFNKKKFNTLKYMSKKTVLWSSLIIFALLGVINYYDYYFFPRPTVVIDYLRDVIIAVNYISLFSFVISLITYKMKERVFRAWMSFSYFGVPTIFALSFVITYMTGGYIPPSVVSILLTYLYSLISIILIIYKYFSLRTKPTDVE